MIMINYKIFEEVWYEEKYFIKMGELIYEEIEKME